MRKISSAVRKFSRAISRKPVPDIVGYVERITNHEIHGWVISRKNAEVRLTIHINGRGFPVSADWLERADVATQFGEQYSRAGFRLTVSGSCGEALALALRYGAPIAVSANQVALRDVADRPQTPEALRPEPLSLEIRNSSLHARIERSCCFTISGSVSQLNPDSPSPTLDVLANGKPLTCSTIYHICKGIPISFYHLFGWPWEFQSELPGRCLLVPYS